MKENLEKMEELELDQETISELELMNHQRSNRVMAFTDLGEYYFTKITINQAHMYAEDVEDFSLSEIYRAIFKYRRDPKNLSFPYPVQLRSLMFAERISQNEKHETLGED